MEMELVQLGEELKRQKENSKDLVVDSRNLGADRGGNVPLLMVSDRGDIQHAERYPLTDWAHGQLADKCGIPNKYYNRILEAGKIELWAQNVDAWIPEKERRLVRILDGKVRAILSDRYRRMDNYDLVFATLDALKDKQVDIQRCDLTETHMYMKAVQLHNVREIQEDDKVVPGILLSNSEVGAGSFKVEPFMLRLVCSNGMIGESVIRKVHLGERKNEGLYSDNTIKKEDEYIWSAAHDVIEATFDPTVFDEWVKQVRRGTEVDVPSPTTAADNLAVQYNISEDRKRDLLDYFTTKEAPTQWGLANAVTFIAKQEEIPENQVELERLGNVLATMEAKEFTALTKKDEEK